MSPADEARVDAYVRRVVSGPKPLTPEQVAELRRALRPTGR
jgi:hypothetical protein